MHDRAAGEIYRAELCGPAAAPHPVGERVVDDRCPEQRKDQVCTELYTLGKTGRDDCHRDRCKHELEYHVQHARNKRTVRPGVHAYAIQAQVLQVTDKSTDIRTKRKRVPDQHPLDADESKGHKRQRDHIDEVFLPYKTPVEEPDSRGHYHDEGR